MKVLLSPAKSLNYEHEISTPQPTKANFLEESSYLVKKLQKLSKKQLADLMSISEQLSNLNHERYQNWVSPEELNSNAKPAVTVFTGEVYKGLAVEDFTSEDFEKAQQQLLILSGLYGVLRPLDLMYPYRLEMGTKFEVTPKMNNLYKFWGSKIAEYINSQCEEGELIVNLASNEYFKAVDKQKIKNRIITPVFKELKGDKFKVIMMYAKHARGAMAREIVINSYSTIEEIKSYNVDGYSFSEEMSKENEFVFIR